MNYAPQHEDARETGAADIGHHCCNAAEPDTTVHELRSCPKNMILIS